MGSNNFCKFFICLAVLVATSCSTYQAKEYEITFLEENPLTLNVKSLDINFAYKPKFKHPNVEHLFPYPIEKAVKEWAENRIVSTGKSNAMAILTINDASIVNEKLGGGFLGLKGKDKYVANLQMTLSIEEINTKSGHASVLATENLILPTNFSREITEDKKVELVEDLVKNAGNALENQAKHHLSKYIVKNK